MTSAHLPYHVVNAFTDSTFGGNPAAVMLLDKWLPDAQLQALAAQHNLSETAFLVQQSPESYALRWFTPIVEVPLCGHATLAAAQVLVNELGAGNGPFYFETRYRGILTAETVDNKLAIDLPAVFVESHQVEMACAQALGATVVGAVRPIDDPWQVLYELENEEAVRNLVPDIKAMAEAVAHCVIVTARAKKADFVSRMFAPHLGVDEDPVTGSAHCMLTPFWSARLGKTSLSATQCSARGGELQCLMIDDRVRLAGQAVTFAAGTVIAPVF
jgi:PhzF family phenazine biosynthesis protein|tara:strand:+ start:276 stop:1091 length:816 start_codon:yes stop_codon:yes gene_type:complete